MSNWIYPNGIACVAVPTRNGIEAYGFIYRIDIDDKYYIGKKIFYTTKKKWFGKKKLATMTDARLKKYEYVKKPSNWMTYCSSSEEIRKLVEEGHVPERYILQVCYSKKELTFMENKWLYSNIQNRQNINDNISGMFFKEEIKLW